MKRGCRGYVLFNAQATALNPKAANELFYVSGSNLCIDDVQQ